MGKYIELETLLTELDDIEPDEPYETEHDTWLDCRLTVINAQTADVAPKSEVAREIFEEIEFDIHQLMFERDETRAIAIEGIIANLKKKYTEGES